MAAAAAGLDVQANQQDERQRTDHSAELRARNAADVAALVSDGGPAATAVRSPRRRLRVRGGAEIVLTDDSITAVNGVQAIVNAANETLEGGGGVDQAIHAVAGPDLHAACLRIAPVRVEVDGGAIPRGDFARCPVGEARVTPAFQLPAPIRYVVHTVAPLLNAEGQPRAELLRQCYVSCLEAAEAHSVSSLAFCALGTGFYGFPQVLACQIALQTTVAWLQDRADKTLRKVVFCMYGAHAKQIYPRVLGTFGTEWALPSEDEDRGAAAKQPENTTCTAIIVHPTHERGILSAIVPALKPFRELVLPFLPKGPRVVTLKQGRNIDDVGQLLWRSGIALATFLGREAAHGGDDGDGGGSGSANTCSDRWRGKRCIELGCGCSPLASIVLAEWGARCAVATDGEDLVLALAHENAMTNSTVGPPTLRVEKLWWGDESAILKLLAAEHGGGGGPFDVVVAADVIYHPKVHDALISTLVALGGPETVYYIGFQIRLHAFEGEFFAKKLPEHGFSCEVVSVAEDTRVKVVKAVRARHQGRSKRCEHTESRARN